jgi:hypothetical protein
MVSPINLALAANSGLPSLVLQKKDMAGATIRLSEAVKPSTSTDYVKGGNMPVQRVD